MATPLTPPPIDATSTQPAPAGRISIDIVNDAAGWQAFAAAEDVVRAAILAAIARAGSSLGGGVTLRDGTRLRNVAVVVALVDDDDSRRLNLTFRGIDKPTNVLAFPAPASGQPPTAPRDLGDIAIAFGTCAREAGETGKPLDHHLSHLAIHGFLHLIGYDHDTDDQASAMESLERTILADLKIPDPYASTDRED